MRTLLADRVTTGLLIVAALVGLLLPIAPNPVLAHVPAFQAAEATPDAPGCCYTGRVSIHNSPAPAPRNDGWGAR